MPAGSSRSPTEDGVEEQAEDEQAADGEARQACAAALTNACKHGRLAALGRHLSPTAPAQPIRFHRARSQCTWALSRWTRCGAQSRSLEDFAAATALERVEDIMPDQTSAGAPPEADSM